MALTKEQANEIKVTRDTEVGDLCSYEGAHHKICAENLAKWAYHRLETWFAYRKAREELVRFCESKKRHAQFLSECRVV